MNCPIMIVLFMGVTVFRKIVNLDVSATILAWLLDVELYLNVGKHIKLLGYERMPNRSKLIM